MQSVRREGKGRGFRSSAAVPPTGAAVLATAASAAAADGSESHSCFGGILLAPLSSCRHDGNY